MNLKLKALLLSLIPLILFSGCWQSGDAEYVGVVTKIGHIGAVFSTWEVELHLVDQKGTMVADQVSLSVDASAEHDENTREIVAALKDAQNKGTRVKISAQREVFVGCWRADQNRLITKVELLN